MKRSVASWRFSRAAVVLALIATVAPVATPAAATAAPPWQRYVLGPASAQVAPVAAQARGSVSNAQNLVRGKGKPTALTTVAGGTPASVVLDFGHDIAGTPFVDVTAVQGTPTLTLVTGEARGFLRHPAATTVATAATTGATAVVLASAANLEPGNTITFGTGADAQTRTITGFDTTARTVSFGPALPTDVAAGTAVATSPGAPASDEAHGLAGVGGQDTLQPMAPGRVSGGFHGGFRFILLTLTSPGSVSLSAVGVDFQALRATPADYRGWFLSSDNQLNRMWYSGAYTLQLDLKPAGSNGLPDARIYDGAKRDRSFDGYLASLPASTRSAVRREIRRFHAAGGVVEVRGPNALDEQLARLHSELQRRHGIEVTPDAVLRAFHKVRSTIGEMMRVFVARDDTTVLGFVIVLDWHGQLYGRQAGFVHGDDVGPKFVYFNTIYYAVIHYAIDNKIRRIEYSTESYDAKQRRGCTTTPLLAYVRSETTRQAEVADYLSKYEEGVAAYLAAQGADLPRPADLPR